MAKGTTRDGMARPAAQARKEGTGLADDLVLKDDRPVVYRRHRVTLAEW
jgi:hypothetical protein